MPFPVDVIAVFNPSGQVKPLYLRLEDENHALITLAVQRVLYRREEKYGGLRCFRYTCEVGDTGQPHHIIDLYYHIETHKWLTEPSSAVAVRSAEGGVHD